MTRYASILVLLGLSGTALAQTTTPVSGAVSKPADFAISLPFQAGEQVYLTSGYSPSGGSSLHDGTDRTTSANDYYAIDFTLPGYPDNGHGQPVLAIASGTVVAAGWGTVGWASYGQRVYIEHDYTGDGNHYISLYAHLDSIAVAVGDEVAQGQQIGALGGSSGGSMTGTGYHLHFALHQNSTIGGSGTGGSYGGHAVVPEPIDGYGMLGQGQTLVSDNSGGPTPPCAVIPGEGAVLDDQGPCFRRYGPASYWHDESAGYADHAVWTYTIDAVDPDNSVRWNLYFDGAGSYRVRAYVPGGLGQSTQAAYSVTHAGTTTEVVRDQSSVADGWLTLGTFEFAAGGDQYVALADNTGEPYTGTDSTRIAFDAIDVAPAGVDPSPDAGVIDSPDAGSASGPDAGVDLGADAGGEPPSESDAGEDNGASGGFVGGCSTGGGGRGQLVWLLLVACGLTLPRGSGGAGGSDRQVQSRAGCG